MKRDQHDPFCSGIVASSRAIRYSRHPQVVELVLHAVDSDI